MDHSQQTPYRATAIAHPNIALVKYWGKRDRDLNLPDGGSISITLAELRTRTTVEFDPALAADELYLNGRDAPAQLPRVSAVLDLLRASAQTSPGLGTAGRPLPRARVTSENDFPTGAGLASSASGFAALVTAADAALGLGMPRSALSEYARRGSGSAARSLFGGFVELARGRASDGSDCRATPIAEASTWPLEVAIAVTSTASKSVTSGAGMELSRATSPFYPAWAAENDTFLARARAAIHAEDFAELASVSEASCLDMHAVMLSTRPPLAYWNGSTVDCLHTIRALRETHGLATFFTIDAGPQVKAVCLPGDAAEVARALSEVPGVIEVRRVGLGAGAQTISERM